LERKAVSGLVPTLLLLCTFVLAFNSHRAYANVTTRVFVDPFANTADWGEDFTVNINVENVTGLHVWQFYMYFNSSLLNATLISEGSFSSRGGTLNTAFLPKYYNSLGYIYAVDTVLSSSALDTLTGNGTLATVTFKVLEPQGRTALHINQTQLIDLGTYLEPPKNMPHTEEDGYFAVPMPVLSVNPAAIRDPTKLPGSSFDVSLTVVNMESLHSWNATIKWDPSIIDMISVTEGAFLKQVGMTSFSYTIHAVDGYAVISGTLVGASAASSGNGTLATMTFNVLAFGLSLLDLRNTFLLDSAGNTIIHVAKDGFFANAVPDLAVTRIELSANKVTIGDTLTIRVTVKNMGSVAVSTFHIAVTATGTAVTWTVGTVSVTGLDPGGEVTTTITWDTWNVDPGDYVIKAIAESVTDETNTTNNTLIGGTVTVGAAITTYTFCAGTWNLISYYVQITSNSTVSGFIFNAEDKVISFDVTGVDGNVGFCEVTIPNALLGGPYTISVENVPPLTLNERSNGTLAVLYFTYHQSTQNVKITGATAVPEFPAATLMPLLVALTFIAAILTNTASKKPRNRLTPSKNRTQP